MVVMVSIVEHPMGRVKPLGLAPVAALLLRMSHGHDNNGREDSNCDAR